MFHVPVTFLFDYERADAAMRPYIFHEFAANGAKHVVLSDTLISAVMQNYGQADQLRKELAQEGLTFADAHSPYGPQIDLCCPDPVMHCHAMMRHILAMEICALFGVDTITIHVGNNWSFPDTPQGLIPPDFSGWRVLSGVRYCSSKASASFRPQNDGNG